MRADELIFKLSLVRSRHQAKDLIKRGLVKYKGKTIPKPSYNIPENAVSFEFEIKNSNFVSRAAEKLEHAFKVWGLDVKDKVCIDVGASTGGFSQVLLANGARRVYAIEVGTNQLHPSLKNNPKLISLEKTDIRNLTSKQMSELAEFFCVDVSFISLEKVLPSLSKFLKPGAQGVLLFKPQFEVGKEFLNKKGSVLKENVSMQFLKKFIKNLKAIDYEYVKHDTSPITGESAKNKEYIILVNYKT